MATGQRFHIADFVVFTITVLVSLAIGIYYAFSGGKQKTITEYLLGGRLISFLPVAISLLASFESSIMMLGLPAEGYFYGTQLIAGVFGSFFVYMMAVHLMVPLIHPLKITSGYEYLELRFQSKSVRLLGTAMGMLNYVWYMGIVLFGPAVALEAVTGFPLWISIVSISIVSVIYTSIGGMKAVVWTDVFQSLVMFMGIFAVLIKGTLVAGGAKDVWDIAMEGGRLELFNFDPDPMVRHTFWCLTFGSIFRNMAFCFNQGSMQRISSTRTMKDAKRVIYIVAPCFCFVTIIAIYEGVVTYAYYQVKGCDPFESGQITNTNQLLPFMVMDIFKDLPGMPGLFLASLFSASLSTLSTCLSSISAMMWSDIIHPVVGDISDFKGALIAKLSVLIFGGAACGLAFLVASIGGTLHQIAFSVLASFSAPTTGLFVLGCLCPRVTARGAVVGGLAGLITSCWISFGMNFSPSVKPSPMLPPASIDHCYPSNLTSSHDYRSVLSYGNTTSTTTTTTRNPSIFTTMGQTDHSPEGVDVLYNLSYNWVPVIGMLTTIITGYLASLITGPNKPGDVDPRYLLDVSRSVLYFLPSRLQNWLASLGTQFNKEEYKDKFPDPALNRKSVDTDDLLSLSNDNHKSKCQLLEENSKQNPIQNGHENSVL